MNEIGSVSLTCGEEEWRCPMKANGLSKLSTEFDQPDDVEWVGWIAVSLVEVRSEPAIGPAFDHGVSGPQEQDRRIVPPVAIGEELSDQRAPEPRVDEQRAGEVRLVVDSKATAAVLANHHGVSPTNLVVARVGQEVGPTRADQSRPEYQRVAEKEVNLDVAPSE